MDFVKKEWKAIILVLCLIGIVVYLSQINSHLNTLRNQNAKLLSTIDSIESIALGTDAGVNDSAKKIDGIDANMSYVVQKLRRR
jgi:hypothetical protein